MAVVRSHTISYYYGSVFQNEVQTGNGSNTKAIYVTLSNACAMQFYFDYYYYSVS